MQVFACLLGDDTRRCGITKTFRKRFDAGCQPLATDVRSEAEGTRPPATGSTVRCDKAVCIGLFLNHFC